VFLEDAALKQLLLAAAVLRVSIMIAGVEFPLTPAPSV